MKAPPDNQNKVLNKIYRSKGFNHQTILSQENNNNKQTIELIKILKQQTIESDKNAYNS